MNKDIDKLITTFHDLKKHIPYLEVDKISDTYFIFKQYVLFFHSVKTPSFQYALWLDKDGSITYIGEHKELIDKFKPSRTPISTKDMDEFISIFKTIEENPVQAFVASLNDIPWDFPAFVMKNDYAYGYQAVWDVESKSYVQDMSISKDEFVQKEFKNHWTDKRKRQQEFQAAFYSMMKMIPELFLKEKVVRGVGLIDLNKMHGCRVSPRYNIVVSIDIHEIMKAKSSDDIFRIIDELIDEWNAFLIKKGEEIDASFGELWLHKPMNFELSADKLGACKYKWIKEKPKKLHKRSKMLERCKEKHE